MKRAWFVGLVGFVLAGAVWAADPRHEIAFPDIPGYQTLKCDFHTHTMFSDGEVWPTVRVEEAWREGFDVLAITDHIEYQPHRADVPTSHNRPYELAETRAREHGILLIRGAEITRDTPPGHFNAIFLADVTPLDVPDFFAVFEAAAAQWAFCFWNHPGWKGEERGRWGAEQQTLYDRQQLHGIEICNGDSYYEYAHRLAHEKNLTLVGSSDIHEPSRGLDSFAGGHRTLTLVFAAERTTAAVHAALRARRTVVWCGERLYGGPTELRALFEAALRIEAPHHSTKKYTWVRVRNQCAADISLRRVGEHGPRQLELPAGATTLVRLEVSAEALRAGLPYRVENFVPAPGESLDVTLTFPQTAVPAAAPACTLTR